MGGLVIGRLGREKDIGVGEWEVGSGKCLVGEGDSIGRSFDWGIWSNNLCHLTLT